MVFLFVSSGCAQLEYMRDPLSAGTPIRNSPEYEWHGFYGTDKLESPNIEILDYQYGNIKPEASDYESAGVLNKNKRSGPGGTFGVIKRGEFFYIKWKDVISGALSERTVDLKSRLPIQMYGTRITFGIRDNRLSIYLVTPAVNINKVMQNVPNSYAGYIVKTLYSE